MPRIPAGARRGGVAGPGSRLSRGGSSGSRGAAPRRPARAGGRRLARPVERRSQRRRQGVDDRRRPLDVPADHAAAAAGAAHAGEPAGMGQHPALRCGDVVRLVHLHAQAGAPEARGRGTGRPRIAPPVEGPQGLGIRPRLAGPHGASSALSGGASISATCRLAKAQAAKSGLIAQAMSNAARARDASAGTPSPRR